MINQEKENPCKGGKETTLDVIYQTYFSSETIRPRRKSLVSITYRCYVPLLNKKCVIIQGREERKTEEKWKKKSDPPVIDDPPLAIPRFVIYHFIHYPFVDAKGEGGEWGGSREFSLCLLPYATRTRINIATRMKYAEGWAECRMWIKQRDCINVLLFTDALTGMGWKRLTFGSERYRSLPFNEIPFFFFFHFLSLFF